MCLPRGSLPVGSLEICEAVGEEPPWADDERPAAEPVGWFAPEAFCRFAVFGFEVLCGSLASSLETVSAMMRSNSSAENFFSGKLDSLLGVDIFGRK